MNYVVFLLIFIYLMWFILSIICQFKNNTADRIREWDIFHIIPAWTFFSPNPGVKDYSIYIKYIGAENTSSLQLLNKPESNNCYSFIFNPKKIRRKSVIDMSQLFTATKNKFPNNPEMVLISVPYLVILNYITNADVVQKNKDFKFLIVAEDGYKTFDDPMVLFLSNIHRK